MTDKEKQDIIDAVLLQIQNNSQSVDTLKLADSLNGVSSLPCVKGEELVSVPLSLFEKIVSDTAASSASGAIIEETNARISADANLQAQITETKDGNAELLKRIIGKSTSSSAYTDPFKYLENFASEKDENGTVTKHAIRVMQDYLLVTLRHSDYRDSFPYIGHMRAHIEGVPIEMWTYVKAWNTGSTNGVFVQVVRTNFGLKNGVISSALTESFHEYHRTVTVGMANGSVTDVTATEWKESNSDISDMAAEGISKADAALSQIAEEAKERTAADAELRTIADEGVSKADSALSQIAEETRQRTAADAELQATDKANEDLAKEGISKAESASAMLFAEEAARKEADLSLNDLIEAEVTERLQSVATEAAERKAADAELQTKIQDHEDRIWKLENQWYGIEWDTEVSSPSVTRIGNMDLHRTLPIQSRMRGCLLDDNGKVTKYLNPKDWTGEVRDGSRGQVMVEIPIHYRRCETEGTKRRVKLSEYPLHGFLPIPRMYPSAYEATLQRSTKKLCSVVNTDPDFRGGNNQAAWDGTYRSLLGRPVTNINRTNFRTYARNRNNAATAEWNIYTYHVHKALYWLYVVEYANRNSQLPFTAELTAEGFHQGGLGAGVTTWDINWSTFNGYYPFVPCGHTDSLGNRTGVVSYTAKNDDESITKTFDVPRYRGVENPFGHIWKWTDGCNIQVSATQENGGTGLSKAFICHAPANFQDSNYANYSHVGNIDRSGGYVEEVLFGVGGEILPKTTGGGSTTYFCDKHYTNIPSSGEALRGLLFGCIAHSGATAGLASADSHSAPSYSTALVGSRLCFIPAE